MTMASSALAGIVNEKKKVDKNFIQTHTSWTIAIVGVVSRIVYNPKRS
jgi:hypothetical protein